MAGIAAGNALPHLSWWMAAVALAVCAGAAWAWRGKDAGGIYTALSLFFFAMAMTYLTATRDIMPKGERLIMTVRIEDNPQTSGRWTKVTAIVGKYRLYGAGHDAADDPGMAWKKSGEKVILRVDTAHAIAAGDRLIVTGRAGEIGNESYGGYVRLMRRRGYSATVWTGAYDKTILLPGKARTPSYLAARMQAWAAERLGRLDLSKPSADVAAAMSIGTRQNLSPEINESYAVTGATHLLSVSGLHVGIVAMLINALLYLLPAVRYGHILKNLVAVAAVWLYAMLAGLSPPVVRSAMMLTGVQFALASSRAGSGMNILLGTAAVMLMLNPNYLYDVSFQLTFAAMLGIFTLYAPMFGLVKTRFRWANALWSVFIIGVAATAATAPLVAVHFGRIPVIGILMNPIVVLAANITILLSMFWVIFPFGFLNGLFSAVIEFSAGLQNRIVEFCASLSWGSVSIGLTGWQAVFVYLALLAAYLLVRYRRARKVADGKPL